MNSRAALVDAVCAASDVVRKRTHERVRRDVLAAAHLSDGPFDDEAIDAAFDLQHERITIALRGAMSPDGTPAGVGPEPTTVRPTAQRLALLRLRPDLTLSACGAAISETIDCVRSIGTDIGADPSTVVDVVSAVVHASDMSSVPLWPAGHGGTELPETGSDDQFRASLARTLLLGGASSADIRSQVSVSGLDTGRTYVAFRAHPLPGHTMRDLARELGHAGPRRPCDGLAVNLDGDLVGFLATPPVRARAGIVGIGPPGILERLAESFELATRTLRTARAFGLSGVHTFDELGLLPVVLADADTGESLYRRYVQPLVDVRAVPGLLNAIRAYFACGMHVDRAARQLHIHPNTLRHRISRFEELTGADLSDLTVAMEVWWALMHATRCASAARAHKPPAEGALGVVTPLRRPGATLARSERAV